MEALSPPPPREADQPGSRPVDLDRIRSIEGRGGSSWKRRSHFWLRWAHVYISMFSLLVMLFFGITGITLNHPDWMSSQTETSNLSGTLPAAALANGEVEFLLVSDYIRSQHDVGGEVADFGLDDGQGSITYRAPGYSADLFFDATTGGYDLAVTQDGFVGLMNALHQGRDSSPLWRWIIDISGGLLVVVALTGLGIQFFLKKRRFTALTVSVVGGLVTVGLIWLALP